MSADNEIKKSAEEAVKAEQEAIEQGDVGSYTHIFKKPFTYEGVTYDELTFDLESLTGNDSLEVERELLAKGITLVAPEFDGNYLAGIAARACTYRSADNRRTVSHFTISALPIGDFRKICREVRSFLLRAGQ